jgi:hypothetical protein
LGGQFSKYASGACAMVERAGASRFVDEVLTTLGGILLTLVVKGGMALIWPTFGGG